MKTGNVVPADNVQPSAAALKATSGSRHKLIRLFENNSAAKLAGFYTDARFLMWRLLNPGGSFAEFYASTIARKLARGGVHKTLGTRNYQSASLVAQASPQDSKIHSRRGRPFFLWMKKQNLKPSDVCLDYGCGSLRVGQHLISYLDAGNYLGLDIVDKFYSDGLLLLNKDITTAKSPWFGVINADTLQYARSRKPDIIYSTAVMQHVPPADLPAYLGKIFSLMKGNVVAVINFKAANATTRIGANAWAYSEQSIAAAVLQADPAMKFQVSMWNKDSEQRLLIASRSGDKITAWTKVTA
jgi:trans-aconitate methyltransferase